MQKIKNYIPPFIIIFIVFSLIFTRSFVGLKIFNFRIGEYVVLIGFIILFICTAFSFKNRLTNEFGVIGIISVYFLLQLLFNQSNLTNTYLYKAGSFVGMTAFFYLGYHFPKKNQYSKKIIRLMPFLIPIIYLFGSSLYPSFLGDFFIRYSDKYEFIKASDVLMALVVIVFISNVYEYKSLNHFFVFIVIPAFLPQLLYLSRGSFLALVLFFLLEIYYMRKDLYSNLIKSTLYTLIAVIVFLTSTLQIYGNLSFEKLNPLINAELEKAQTEVFQENIQDLIDRRNYIGVIFSLYMDNGTLKSTDGTLNWRLDIWQDLINDINSKNKIFFGYGYDEIFSVMTDPSEPGRMGQDGMNENIHNYFLNVYARGGIFLLILYLTLHFMFIKKWKDINGNYRLISFVVPLLIASFFDVSMEGVQFPLNYYFFVGYFINLKT